MNMFSPKARVVTAVFGFVLFAAGCTEFKEDLREPAPQPKPPPPVATAPAPAVQIPAPAAEGLTLNGNCVGKEETGYAENVRLDVAGGQVRQLEARIDIPRRGSCSYRLADFTQTRQTPFVELLARSNAACAIRMWQQGDRITVAATDCPEKCTRGAFEYAWPIEFNTAGGCF